MINIISREVGAVFEISIICITTEETEADLWAHCLTCPQHQATAVSPHLKPSSQAFPFDTCTPSTVFPCCVALLALPAP